MDTALCVSPAAAAAAAAPVAAVAATHLLACQLVAVAANLHQTLRAPVAAVAAAARSCCSTRAPRCMQQTQKTMPAFSFRCRGTIAAAAIPATAASAN